MLFNNSRRENRIFISRSVSHKGKKIKISKETSNWDDGAVPNPVPFYMSTNGYGATALTLSARGGNGGNIKGGHKSRVIAYEYTDDFKGLICNESRILQTPPLPNHMDGVLNCPSFESLSQKILIN